jgi:ubiquinone/menaquinone biosynthesis C-methylase UbiE
MKNYWSEYWSQGYLTSFGQDIKNNYTGKLKNSWLDFRSTLHNNVSILDIGTGNGALLELIQNQDNLSFNCTGIDSAQINEKVSKQISGNFISNVKAEELPFDDAEFDVVISQFALEYSDLNKSIIELFRVLKPGGRFQFVCHEQDSDIVKPNVQILDAALRVEQNVLPTLTCLVDCLVNNKSDDEDIKKNMTRLEQLISDDKKINNFAIDATQITSFYSFILKNRTIDLKKALRLFIQELEGLILRLTDLKHAAENNNNILLKLESQCAVKTTYLIDEINKERIGMLYTGSKNIQ